MFRIYDGRERFFQWDISQRLIVEDASVDRVHFCNRTSDCSVVRDVYEEDGLRIVNVPNILLQDSYAIHVYAFCANCTKVEEVFKVTPRSRPTDYVYTDEEIKTWDELEARIEYLEKHGSGGVNITNDGDGNATIDTTGGMVSIIDDGNGNVVIQ